MALGTSKLSGLIVRNPFINKFAPPHSSIGSPVDANEVWEIRATFAALRKCVIRQLGETVYLFEPNTSSKTKTWLMRWAADRVATSR